MDHEIEDRGSVLFGASRGMSNQLASEMLDEGVIDEMMPPQETYRNKRRKELRRLLYNLIRARSLSRAYGTPITVGVPLRKIKRNEAEYHRVSYRSLTAVMETLSDAGLIEVRKGRRFLDASTEWKKRCLDEGELKNRMTELWAVGPLKEAIGRYLSEHTDVGADVEILVEEGRVVLRDNDGNHIRRAEGPEAGRMEASVRAVNEAVGDRDVRLLLPVEEIGGVGTRASGCASLSSSSLFFPISVHTSPQPTDTRHSADTRHPAHTQTAHTQTSDRRPTDTQPIDTQSIDTEQLHQQVRRRCPEMWDWGHEEREGGLAYRVPERGLTYNRKFCRGSWDCGGRFYADVQNVPSDWRRHMRIGREPAVELDYDSLHVHMLYAREGKRLDGDAYDITAEFDLGAVMDSVIGLSKEEKEVYRSGQRAVVKTALNVLVNAANHQSAYQALKKAGWEETVGLPLADDVFKPLVHALRAKHEPIEDHLHSDAGIGLQRTDSDLAHRVMTETGAIGIHDGFLIEASREEELQGVMTEAFTEAFEGYRIGVSREFEPPRRPPGGG